MSLDDEITALHSHLEELALTPDEELVARYRMEQPRRPPGLYWQLRWLAGRMLRWFRARGILPAEPWPVSLKHARTDSNAKPLLIWAVGVEAGTLRRACTGISGLLDDVSGLAPVLVTDVADFAFFSRLGWLVEYVPKMAGAGEDFDKRKARFLARLYRGATPVPVGVGLAPSTERDRIRRLLQRDS